MNKTIFILLTIGSLTTHAQTITPEVKATAGTSFQTSYAQISYTMGETFTTTLSPSSNIMTQGYQQTKLNFIPNGIDLISQSNQLTYFPQPSSSSLIVQSEENVVGYKVALFDNTGKEVLQEGFNNSQVIIDVSSFKDGIYEIAVSNDKNVIVSKRQVSIIH